MEWLKKIDPNIIVYLIITGIVLFVLINLNVIRIGGNNENDVIEQYITDKQLDSLYHVIEKNNSNIKHVTTLITMILYTNRPLFLSFTCVISLQCFQQII